MFIAAPGPDGKLKLLRFSCPDVRGILDFRSKPFWVSPIIKLLKPPY